MIYDVYEFMCVCVKLASRYTPICLSANRCISIASARPQKHTSLYIQVNLNYSLYINYTFVKALPKHYERAFLYIFYDMIYFVCCVITNVENRIY